jgi:hypothetical protein
MERNALLVLLYDLTAPPHHQDIYEEQREELADYLLSLEGRLDALERSLYFGDREANNSHQ